ncbi:MAG: HAMP domain-containing sensor histidine kinase [Flavobacteriales bacterium]|nr:HAMP domain-containing sensor histidine kinase [Flavobacteriales bacterium]MDG1933760.1 HAMP domain-containing sensor histidine kinase [Flavobacteriales bacterium]MDG2086361.1 HAMP domain-containing sensor histidine kinase [Flavobacteriales bacterium]|tara:strand:+ start:6310 stop:7521 length:1212 start_codon:yes stop_codon:yes gene_type:complete
MNIYSKKKNWKFVLIGTAISIGILSLFITNILVKELKNEERKKIELWADATKQLVGLSGEGDYSLAIKVISENNNIPVILVDECDSILESRNFLIFSKIDSILFKIGLINKTIITPEYLREELLNIKNNGDDPIEVNIVGDKQRIYYKDSALLNRLRFYPVYQLGFISLFMFFAYYLFNASKRSEQNQVWVGMAKETAHQIGTPLSSLMAWTELLKEQTGNEKMVIEMEKDIKRLETITDRFSKIGSQSELVKYDIVLLINKSIEYLKSRMPSNTIFKISVPKTKILIPVSNILFEWVIENLVKNAVDSMKGKGEILIEVIDDSTFILINIKDTGEGIDKSIFKTLFKPGVTSKKRGWGLGLSLSKRIIEDYHKGSIFVSQSEKGVGTTFTIKLPKNLKTVIS